VMPDNGKATSRTTRDGTIISVKSPHPWKWHGA
jgi:hypothetical protein